jgi:hypothetical protein
MAHFIVPVIFTLSKFPNKLIYQIGIERKENFRLNDLIMLQLTVEL